MKEGREEGRKEGKKREPEGREVRKSLKCLSLMNLTPLLIAWVSAVRLWGCSSRNQKTVSCKVENDRIAIIYNKKPNDTVWQLVSAQYDFIDVSTQFE